MLKDFTIADFEEHKDALVQTKGGRKVRILATDIISDEPIVGVVGYDDPDDPDYYEEDICTWDKDGKFCPYPVGTKDRMMDLMIDCSVCGR